MVDRKKKKTKFKRVQVNANSSKVLSAMGISNNIPKAKIT